MEPIAALSMWVTSGEIENHICLFGANQSFRFLLNAAAIRTGVDAALHLKDSDPLLGSGFHEVENHYFELPFKESTRKKVRMTDHEDCDCSSPS